MKPWMALLGLALVLAAAFFLLPRTLLRLSGNADDNKSQVTPVGKALTPAGTGAAPATPLTRRFESFASIQSGAGFTPLTATSLPAGYQPWEQYLRQNSPAEVVITYVKPDNLYVLVDERVHNPNGRPLFPPQGAGRRPVNGTPAAVSPRVDVGSTPGLYVQGLYGPGSRELGTAQITPIQRNSQPHRVMFTHGDLDVIVEADETDVSRDELIKIAAGLR